MNARPAVLPHGRQIGETGTVLKQKHSARFGHLWHRRFEL
jgi:hypothetical protein